MTDGKSDVREEVKQAVEDGGDVRGSVRDIFERASRQVDRGTHKLIDLASQALDGAVGAIDKATPADPDSTLRQVVEGIGDGLERSAHATKLAVEEAAGSGKAFAKKDLDGAAEDLTSVGERFVDTVEEAVSGATDQTREHLSNARTHAERTLEAIGPSLQAAAHAAMKDPVGLAQESAEAAMQITREAAGALFSAAGGFLKSAGDKLSGGERQEGGS